MNKKTGIIISSIILGVAVLSASTVIFFRYWNTTQPVAAAATEFSIPESSQESSEPISVPPITAEPKKVAEVIEEPTVSKPEDSVPPPEVTESTEPDGGVVQTPNWEAQKELAPDADLNDPAKEPEYVKPPQASSKPAAPASSASSKSGNTGSTPKNGDTKTENGKAYTYVKGFGWVQDGNGGSTEYVSGQLSGEKIGN